MKTFFSDPSARRRVACALLLGALGAFAACAPREDRIELEEIPGVVPAPDNLRFSVRVAPLKFAPGDRVSLEASLFNDSDDTYRKEFDTTCIWDFEITTEAGVPLTAARECVPHDSTVVLAPRELRMIVREWRGRDRYFNAAHALVPGRYRVVAGFLDADRRVIPMCAPVDIEIVGRGGGGR